MNKNKLYKTSKLLSYALRHAPEKFGFSLDKQGYVDIDHLIRCLRESGNSISRLDLEEVVRANDKQRFAFSPDGNKIRASQGHSVKVDLELPTSKPPRYLYHGTAAHSLPSIRKEGLKSQSRNHVHLSASETTAVNVGSRHGDVVVLDVYSGDMYEDGYDFWLSANGVWLVDVVPPEYIGLRGLHEN